ncbi:hypothetical protein [Methylocella silvestris]|uniref:hypothetical protein n=1 Tax=Methylocella silvestris TaxID=199596 RepID=UPI0011D1217F|nr:hypothetical protein [Methylocella silvestris]
MLPLTFLIIALVAVGVDIGVTTLALQMAAAAKGFANESFWVSFWSGLAYSAWVGTVLAIVVGLSSGICRKACAKAGAARTKTPKCTATPSRWPMGFTRNFRPSPSF